MSYYLEYSLRSSPPSRAALTTESCRLSSRLEAASCSSPSPILSCLKKLSFLDLDDFDAVGLVAVLDGGDLGVDDVVGEGPAVSQDPRALPHGPHRLLDQGVRKQSIQQSELYGLVIYQIYNTIL